MTKKQSAHLNPTYGYALRKVPQQTRSKTTVNSIKQAALLIFEESGAAACGTDAIAERAGVSIGSLYQYFPNSGAILSSIYEDVSLDCAQYIKSVTKELALLPVEESSRKMIRMLLDMYDTHHVVLINLVDAMPELQLEEQSYSTYKLVQSNIRSYLIQSFDDIKVKDMERMTFFITQLFQGMVQAYIRNQEVRISQTAFINSLSRIIASYHEGEAAAASGRGPS